MIRQLLKHGASLYLSDKRDPNVTAMNIAKKSNQSVIELVEDEIKNREKIRERVKNEIKEHRFLPVDLADIASEYCVQPKGKAIVR